MPSNYVGVYGNALVIDAANDSQLNNWRWRQSPPVFSLRSVTADHDFVRLFGGGFSVLSITNPRDWNPENNKAECVGAGASIGTTSLPGPASSNGGGGGAYAWADNINPTWPLAMSGGRAGPVSTGMIPSVIGGGLVSADSAGAGGSLGSTTPGTGFTPQGYPGGNGVNGGGGGGAAGPSGPGGDASGLTGGTANGGTIASNSIGEIWPIVGNPSAVFDYPLAAGANGQSGTPNPTPTLGIGGGAGGSSWPSGQVGPIGTPSAGSASAVILTYTPTQPPFIQRGFVTA